MLTIISTNDAVESGGRRRELKLRDPREFIRQLLFGRLLPLGLAFIAITFGIYYLVGRPKQTVDSSSTLKVLTYSSFANSWGPGPEIAKRFEEETKVKVEFQDAGDAGLILKKMALLPTDVVIGLDQLMLPQAREEQKWRDIAIKLPEGRSAVWQEREFVPFDWGAMTFVYREGEINPPQSLQDLLDPRFAKSLSLQDPRTSTPGLQFFFWVLEEFGEEGGFSFLQQLKPNIRSVSSNWSSAYGLFTKREAKLAFSYLTSPLYHALEEKDSSYQASVFPGGHPVQVEYVGVPEICQNCGGASLFVEFLLRVDIQKIIMQKNFMFPANSAALEGTPFQNLPAFEVKELKSAPELMKKREALFERWRQLEL